MDALGWRGVANQAVIRPMDWIPKGTVEALHAATNLARTVGSQPFTVMMMAVVVWLLAGRDTVYGIGGAAIVAVLYIVHSWRTDRKSAREYEERRLEREEAPRRFDAVKRRARANIKNTKQSSLPLGRPEEEER